MRHVITCFVALLLALPALAADNPADVAIQKYLDGQWSGLSDSVAKLIADPTTSIQQKQDLTTIRQALAECRPAWWEQCKSANQPLRFRANVWARSLNLVYNPAGQGIQMRLANGQRELTVAWPNAEMDSPDPAEHGFSKGELNDLLVWCTLGMAATYESIPLREDRTYLGRCMDFRGDITGVYYGSPRARRWGLFLYCLAYTPKYAQMTIVNSRKAVAAAFIAEVVANPEKYPSIQLPATLDADGAEARLAVHLKDWIERHSWTLAEDRSLRAALKSFAVNNDRIFQQKGKVMLPSRLPIALDPAEDAPLSPRRDAWVKERFDAIKR